MIARIDAPLSQWERCVTKCLAERVPSSRFARLAQQFLGQDVEGRLLAERLLIRITDAGHDVLQQSYISAALDSGIFDEAHLLQALLDLTSPGKKAVQHSKKSFGKLSVRDQVAVIRLTTVSCNSRARPTTASQATDILDVVPKWMKRASLVSEETHDEADSYVGADEDIVSLQQAVAGIFCELANNVYVRTILESDLTPDEIKDSQPVGIAHDDLDVNPTLSEGLRIFIAQMSVTLHEYANALRNIQQSFASLRRREEKGTAFESTNTALIGMQLGANIQGASRPGRGGLLLYLDSIVRWTAVCATPNY